MKRRGELTFIKKFQEDIFQKFCTGETLEECYNNLADVAKYWLHIIDIRGKNIDDETIFDLFCESRSMSKDITEYCDKKSNILSTARKLAEILGDDVLEEKLKCEFIVSKYPDCESTADRVLPVIVFKSKDKQMFLEKWLGKLHSYEIRDILDWDYYKTRFVCILQRMIIIPAHFQGIHGLFENIENVKWIQQASNKFFKANKDLEDCITDTSIFYTRNFKQRKNEAKRKSLPEEFEEDIEIKKQKIEHNPAKYRKFVDYMDAMGETWDNFFWAKTNNVQKAYEIMYVKDEAQKKPKEVVTQKTLESYFINANKELEEVVDEKPEEVVLESKNDTDMLVYRYFDSNKAMPFKHKIYMEINELKYFMDLEIVRKELVSGESKEFYVMEVTPEELETYEKAFFFDHFSIKKAHYNCDPLHQTLVNTDCFTEGITFCTLTSTVHQKKIVYVLMENQEIKILAADEAKRWFKDKKTDYNLFFTNKNDTDAKMLLEKLFIPHCFTNQTCVKRIDLNTNISDIQLKLHSKMHEEILLLMSLNKLTGIPIANIDEETIMDIFYLKECRKQNLIVERMTSSDTYINTRNEFSKSGFHDKYSAQLEMNYAFIFAIVEYENILQNKKYTGVKRKEFLVMVDFLKNLLVQSAEGEIGAIHLLDKVKKWIKKECEYISSELKETINVLHQQFLVSLTQHLKKLQIDVFCASLEIFFIDTKKDSLGEAEKMVDFVKSEIKKLPGYEFLDVVVLREFEKIAFIEPELWFYEKNKKYFCSQEEYRIPIEMLQKYFGDVEIDDYYVFDHIKSLDKVSAKVFLRMLSYKRDTHGLVSNCHKLLGISEFTEHVKYDFDFTIFCNGCGCENYLKTTCLKCLNSISRSEIEKECTKYLNHCWHEQVEGDKHCTNCNNIQERRLKEYCACGGKYEFINYAQTYQRLKEFVGTEQFNKKVEHIEKFFNGQIN